MAGNGWDGWEMLEIAEKSWKGLEMPENGSDCQIWKEIDGNGWKWINIAGHG